MDDGIQRDITRLYPKIRFAAYLWVVHNRSISNTKLRKWGLLRFRRREVYDYID